MSVTRGKVRENDAKRGLVSAAFRLYAARCLPSALLRGTSVARWFSLSGAAMMKMRLKPLHDRTILPDHDNPNSRDNANVPTPMIAPRM